MRSAIILALLVAAAASAHDLWIEPSSFRPAAGERVTAALRVGEELQGDELPLTLLFNGKPAANALVIALSKTDPDKAVRARTDARGRVALRIPHGGFWLIKAVHMQAAPPDSGVDWESWWASITFEL